MLTVRRICNPFLRTAFFMGASPPRPLEARSARAFVWHSSYPEATNSSDNETSDGRSNDAPPMEDHMKVRAMPARGCLRAAPGKETSTVSLAWRRGRGGHQRTKHLLRESWSGQTSLSLDTTEQLFSDTLLIN
jgi:hypothetical protein